jgi:hemolysin III
MEDKDERIYFPPAEERINIITHGLGIPLSILALILLIPNALVNGDRLDLISSIVFGVSLVMAYAASTFFHSTKSLKLRRRFNIFDHAAIYVLIAGTYTPFTLITLEGRIGWTIFGIVWSMAIIGIIFKIFYIGKYKLLSTLFYVIMGWLIIGAIKPLMANLPHYGLLWLLAGGIAYTIGAILYSNRKIKFNHAIFHVFVLIGSFCHFMAIYFYVL